MKKEKIKELSAFIFNSNFKLDTVYKYLNGGYFALLSAITSALSIGVAFKLYSSVQEFNFFTNWISDLGRGPNGASITFNLGVMSTSCLMFFFHYYLMKDLKRQQIQKKLRTITWISCICSLSGLFFVGVFPLDFSATLHGIAASFYFYGSFFWCLFYTLLERKSRVIPKFQVVFGFIVGLFYFYYNVIALSALVIPFITEEIVKFSEWLTLFAALSWLIERGFFTIISSSTGGYTIAISSRGITLKKTSS
ncbi:MAG: DUF998 domain-containing protein [Promethearchaeota archaeon]